jgi:hypothetical protein
VIGRFDFSKINEKFASQEPEWLYKGVKGEEVNYNGQVHTCVNGGYQQEYLFKILSEAIDRYPLDGVFFNMIGYRTSDYSRNNYGICQSSACNKRFREWSDGLSLPTKEDNNDPVFRKYREFKDETSDELFYRVNQLIKSKGSDIVICTYTDAGVDLIRRESGSHISDDRPAWNFHSTDNVKRALGSFQDKQISNTAVHFVDIPFRHSSVSPHLTRMRLIENMLSGGGLDYYVIGRLENQEDRVALETVTDIFQFHKSNERYFTKLESNSRVCLIRGQNWAGAEFRGLVRILAESQIAFDSMEAWRLASLDTPRPLEGYDLIILPDIRSLSDEACQRIDRYVEAGGSVLATAYTSTMDELGTPLNRFRLKAAGVNSEYVVHRKERGTYLRVFPEDKKHLTRPSFEDLDIVYVHSNFLEFDLEAGAQRYLGLIPPAMYGPPEKCYYTEVTEIPGIILNNYGEGKFAYIPFAVGQQYDYKSHHGHRMIVISVIFDLLEFEPDLKFDTSPLVEIFHQADSAGAFSWIGLANHSGQLGTAFHAPVPIRDIEVDIKPEKPVRRIRLLRAGTELDFQEAEGRVAFSIPELRDFEMAVLEY